MQFMTKILFIVILQRVTALILGVVQGLHARVNGCQTIQCMHGDGRAQYNLNAWGRRGSFMIISYIISFN